MKPALKAAPATVKECDDAWCAHRADVIARERHGVRAGTGLTIELRHQRSGEWHPIMLPNEATTFATATDRDAVLEKLIHHEEKK